MQDEFDDWSIEAWIAEQQRLILEYLKTISGGKDVQKCTTARARGSG